MDLFTLSRGIAKSRMKAATREKIVSIALEATANRHSEKTVIGKSVFYKSDYSINKTHNNIKNTVRSAVNFQKVGKNINDERIYSFLRNSNKFSKNTGRINKGHDFLKDTDFKLSDLDKRIYLKSQFKASGQGTFTMEDLLNDPLIIRKCPEKIKDNLLTSQDVQLHKHFKNGFFNSTDFKNALPHSMEESLKNNKVLYVEKQLDYLVEKQLLTKKESGTYYTTKKFETELSKWNKSFTRNDDYFSEILKGGCSVDELRNQSQNHRQFNSWIKNLEDMRERGLVNLENDIYVRTPKFDTEKRKFDTFTRQEASIFLEKKFDFYENIGLLNKTKNETYQITERYFETYQNQIGLKAEDSFFDSMILDSFEKSTSYEKAKQKFCNSSVNPQIMENLFESRIEKLSFENRITVTNGRIEKKYPTPKNQTEFEFGWMDVKLFRQVGEALSSTKLDDMNIYEKGRLYKLHHQGFVDFKNNSYTISDRGIETQREFLKSIKLKNSIEKFKIDKLSEAIFQKNEFTVKDLATDPTIIDLLSYRKPKGFLFGKYDAFRLFKDFDNLGQLDLKTYKDTLSERFANPRDAEKEFNIRTARLQKNIANGYVSELNKNTLVITDVGKSAAEALRGFNFSEFDAKILHNYVDINDNYLTKEKLSNLLSEIYLDKKELNKEFFLNWKRLENNAKDGYLEFDGRGFSKTNSTKAKTDHFLQTKYAYVYEGVDSKVSYLEHLGFLEKDGDTFRVTEAFKLKHQIDDFKISNQDKSIYKKMANEPLNLEQELEKIASKKKNNEKELKRQQNLLRGRLKKLDNLGLVFEKDGLYKPTTLFKTLLDEEKRHRSIDKKLQWKYQKEDSLFENTKITNFTFDTVVDTIKNNDRLWTKGAFKEHFSQLPDVELNKKLTSTEKHLHSLEKYGYALKTQNGYLIHNEIFERAELRKRSINDRYTDKQITLMNELSVFLNMTEGQITKNIFNSEAIAAYSINELQRKDIIDYMVKSIDGTNQRVYYLKSSGKKEITRITGEDRKIYDSKIHRRPQELEHDLYVYSAYKDYKKTLDEQGCRITKVMTDKDIRAFLNRGEESNSLGGDYKIGTKIEFADLYIEYELPSKEIGFANIEVDVGYKKEVIAGKCNKIDNLMWFTNSSAQEAKILSVNSDAMVKTISL